ncbi:RNA-binding protein [Streptomyces sp. NBC_00876]|uniref:RNA recognition motif domain-containing protein n=1 Tax=Streptomyces sp. NBC_00876 TaxID=2975853 RepID=UPI003862EF48|nr:RNA-binding protein [Streptomyces sp. NBC_00876]
MSVKVNVDNLSWNTTDDDIHLAFSHMGQVLDSIVVRDRDTGRSKGTAVVTYGSQEEADAAVAGLHEAELNGRQMKVSLADAKPANHSHYGSYAGNAGNSGNSGNSSYDSYGQ